jgi:two-component system response regulator
LWVTTWKGNTNMQAEPLVVLLVEDDPGDALIASEALERVGKGHRVHAVSDGQEALDFLHGEGGHGGAPRPDLILLDLNMPRMDGREALTLIKSDPAFRMIPVVVFTTSNAETDIQTSYDAHANAYVIKPMELDQLEAAVYQIDAFYTSIACLPPSHRPPATSVS